MAHTKKNLLFVFDNGGTIIDDPFSECLSRLHDRALHGDLNFLSLPEKTLLELFVNWEYENRNFTFPFASHFLQEEVWIIRVLLKLANDMKLDSALIPEISPRLLTEYRRTARLVISEQPGLESIKKSLDLIRELGGSCGVASNDREFATQSMLNWAGLANKFDWIITSERLSEHEGSVIEKPELRFFKLLEKLKLQDHHPDCQLIRIHIGDSEVNDVVAPRKLGFITARYFNQRNNDSVWLDTSKETIADYTYHDHFEMPKLVKKIYHDLAY